MKYEMLHTYNEDRKGIVADMLARTSRLPTHSDKHTHTLHLTFVGGSKTPSKINIRMAHKPFSCMKI